MQAAREFVSNLAEQISIPAVYGDIRQLILNPRSTVDDSVAVIAGDSMLALRIRRMASSEYFGLPRECRCLRQASEVIGLMQMHDLVLALLCLRTFSGVPGELFNYREFWRYGVKCGIAARTIGRQREPLDNNVFFALGLFAEIGHAAMYVKYPEIALRALDLSLTRDCRVDGVERELLGFDYTRLGAELAQLWRLPPAYEQAAAYHLDPELADADWREAVAIVHLAHRYCQDPQSLRADASRDSGPTTQALLERLPATIVDTVNSQVKAWTDPVLGLLWPRSDAELKAVAGSA